MSSQIELEPGALPWKPAHDAELVSTLHYYDSPLIGVVRQRDVPHMFSCIFGESGAVNLWAYVPITEDEEAQLGGLAGLPGDIFDHYVARLLLADDVTIGVAENGHFTLTFVLSRSEGFRELVMGALRGAMDAYQERAEQMGRIKV